MLMPVKDAELHTALVRTGHVNLFDQAVPGEKTPLVVPVAVAFSLRVLLIAIGPKSGSDLIL